MGWSSPQYCSNFCRISGLASGFMSVINSTGDPGAAWMTTNETNVIPSNSGTRVSNLRAR